MATSCSAPNAAKLGRWYERYPQPSVKVPPQLAKETLLQWIQEGKQPGRDFVVVDVRGSDHTGGFLSGSLNLPIESLYPSLPTLHKLFTSANVKTVIWYCVTSRGRGNCAAAWYGDFLKSQNDFKIESVALTGGILGWVLAGPEYEQHVDEYIPEAWRAEDATKHTGQFQ